MSDRIEKIIKILIDAIEVDDDGDPVVSGRENIKIHDSLMPELIAEINLDPHSLRLSENLLESELNNALVSAKDANDELGQFEQEIDRIKSDIKKRDVTEYRISFPLNLRRKSANLLSDQIKIDETTFTRIKRSTWESECVPDLDGLEGGEMELGSPRHQRHQLREFLDNSPNNITPAFASFWEASFYSRDPQFAIETVANELAVLLGELNFAMQFNSSDGIRMRAGPWPARWSDLRQPFIYLLNDENRDFHTFYYDEVDGSPREMERVHSIKEDAFVKLFDRTPRFTQNYAVDGHLKKGFRAYQSALSNPSQRESFFEFWRALEILSLKDPKQPTKTAVERAESLFDWNNPELAELRTHRIIRKRNDHVHDGQKSDITKQDKNMAKILVDGLLDHHISHREDWNLDQMRFSLDNFTDDISAIRTLKQNREDEIEVLEWMKTI